MAKPKRQMFVVSHQRGKRNKVYTKKEFRLLQEKAASWVDRHLQPWEKKINFLTQKILEEVHKISIRRHFPSELEFYADTIELSDLHVELAKAEYEWSIALIEAHAVFGKVLHVKRNKIEWAARRVSETPREINSFKIQSQVFRDFEATTKRSWRSCRKSVVGLARTNTRLFSSAKNLYQKLLDAKQRLKAAEKQVDWELGGIEEGVQIGLIRERDKQKKRKNALRPLFFEKEQLALALQEWTGFWLRIASKNKKQLKLPQRYIDELVRRKEQAAEDMY